MEINLHSLHFHQNFIHCIKIQFSSEVSPCYCNLMRFFLSPIRFHQYVEDAWISKVPLKLVEVKLETIQSKPVIIQKFSQTLALKMIFLIYIFPNGKSSSNFCYLETQSTFFSFLFLEKRAPHRSNFFHPNIKEQKVRALSRKESFS